MKTIRRIVAVTFALAVAACVLPLASAKGPGGGGGKGGGDEGPSYNIVQLDNTWGGTTFIRGEARDINEATEIVGQVEDPVTRDLLAAFWSSGNELQPLNGTGSSAIGMNDVTEIVGVGYLDGSSVGLYWASPAANPVPLSALTDDYSSARAINNDGVICGVSRRNVYGPDPNDPENIIHLKEETSAVVWKVTSQGIAGPFPLPNLFDLGLTNDPDESNGVAVEINENNEDGVAVVAGTFYRSQGRFLIEIAAVAWSVSFVTTPEDSLQLVVTPTILDVDAFATGVSDNGQVCGVQKGNTPTEDQPVVWAATTIPLNGLPSVKYDTPTAINQNGVIVGLGSYKDRKTQGQRAVVWPSTAGEMILLDVFPRT